MCVCVWFASRELIPYTYIQVYQTHEFLMSHAEVNGFVSEHLLVVLGIYIIFKGKMTTDFSISLNSSWLRGQEFYVWARWKWFAHKLNITHILYFHFKKRKKKKGRKIRKNFKSIETTLKCDYQHFVCIRFTRIVCHINTISIGFFIYESHKVLNDGKEEGKN